ncbi:hypothetical protein [Novosphingobium colocasiae]|uniref:hypothetical protein n=1 Tax=Novosphingobium colocasiae TaxID=1256513 RepID=UPI0035B36991
MGLRSILSNPNGGQLLTGYMFLVPTVMVTALILGHLTLKLLRCETLNFTDGLGALPGLFFVIPQMLKFVRSRHAR